MDDLKIEDADLYALLEIEPNSSANDIKKAYRKKALQCHPDKNPDDPNATREFHKLSKILEILTDEAARKAYDRVLKGRKEAALRHKELDGKRKKFKEDLEAREKTSFRTFQEKSAGELLKEEIERLRKEGSRQVQEEMEYVMKQVFAEQNKNSDEWDSTKYRIKIKWKVSKGDTTNGGYSQELLHKFLSKYGDILVLAMSPTKKNSALVEFNTKRAAEMAMELEKGLADNPLQLTWLNGAPVNSRVQSSTIKDTDYESLVLMKMRQAEERKRLIEQMMADDNDT